jgi:hypothetical protein
VPLRVAAVLASVGASAALLRELRPGDSVPAGPSFLGTAARRHRGNSCGNVEYEKE